MDELEKIRQLRAKDQPLYGRINATTDVEGSLMNMVRDTEANLNLAMQNSPRAEMERQRAEAEALANNVEYPEQQLDTVQAEYTQPIDNQQTEQLQATGQIPRVTQRFGNHSGVEKYSGGVNYGTDFAVKRGTPLGLPPGEWKVVDTFSGAREGNRGANKGSGNLVKVVNTKTGESIAFEHLSNVAVRPGQIVSGGTVIGKSGNTGNSTGPHASMPYKDSQGRYRDILSTPYTKYIFGR